MPVYKDIKGYCAECGSPSFDPALTVARNEGDFVNNCCCCGAYSYNKGSDNCQYKLVDNTNPLSDPILE